nr:uncharacterized protein LOC109159384 [Ipomoea trifida]
MKTEKPNEKSADAEYKDAEVVNDGLHHSNVTNCSPSPHFTLASYKAATMGASSSRQIDMPKAPASSTTHVVNLDVDPNHLADVVETLRNSTIPSVVDEVVNMEVGVDENVTDQMGGRVSSMVAAFNVLKRRRAHITQVAIPNGVGVSFPVWFQQALTSMDEDAIAKCTTILYAIRTARNLAVWEAKVPIPTSMVAVADKSLQNWRLSHSTTSLLSLMHAPAPNSQSHSRCFIDVAYDHDTVLTLLDGGNYHAWSRAVKMTLLSKNKLGFVDRTIKAPNKAEAHYTV